MKREGSRVLRGGSWDDSERLVRCAYRSRVTMYDRGYDVGVRVAVSPV